MQNRLREALGRLWRSFWERRARVAVETAHEDERGGRSEARARFWSEFREGQREAERRLRPR
jgi:hypothetical protein